MKAKIILLSIFIFLGFICCHNKEPERMVVFNDYQLHINETGRGQPTVIIETGLGSGLDSYDTLQTEISKVTRVLSYDRSGLGESSKSPNSRTLPNYINELKLLLEKENILPPYILVGHSLGGLIIRYYTHQFPEEVVGLVFIDCIHEDWFEYFRTTHSKEEVDLFNGTLDHYRNQSEGVVKEEWEQFEYNMEIIRGIEIPQNIPTRIITATQYGKDQQNLGYHPEDMKVWAKMQARIINNVKDAKQIITDISGHSIQFSEPELIINAVKELIEIYENNQKI